MIYAIGDRAKYLPVLQAPGSVRKQGRAPGYLGGSVWRSVDDAKQFIAANDLDVTHIVFEIDADWDADAYQRTGEPFRRLTRDALIGRWVA